MISFFVLAATVAAQNQLPEAFRKSLPTGAEIIETSDLTAAAGKSRALVLWMEHPLKVERGADAGYCGDLVYGDHWLGPTRLSLVDPAGGRLLNTVKVVGPAFMGDPADSFRLPYFVQNAYYYVPNAGSNREGKPRILQLRDLNGDGVRAEFALLMYIACGALNTGALGFNQRSGLAVQYPVELIVGDRTPEVQLWVSQVFAQQPIRPGRWSFTWRPGHGSEEIIHDEVSFDPSRQMFIDRREIRK